MASDMKFHLKATALFVLAWERLWPLLVPFFIVASLFLIFSWSGGWRFVSSEAGVAGYWLVRILFGVLAAASLWPIRNFTMPGKDEVTRHVEKHSKLENRPITAQSDSMATGGEDAFAHALWREHQARMSNTMKDMTAGSPVPDGNRFDPYALRAMVPIVAFLAFFFSYSSNGGRLADIIQIPEVVAEVPVRMDAWLAPPSYTRKPPVFLSSKNSNATGSSLTKAVSVPENSEFFLRFIGEGELSVVAGVDDETKIIAEKPVDETTGHREYSFVVADDTVIRLTHRGAEIAQWGVSVVLDKAPKISFVEDPSGALSGSLQLTYLVEDDYGLKEGKAEISSKADVPDGARPLVGAPEVALSLPRTRGKKAVSKLNKDLTEHPWAGSDVTITLEVTDHAGQVGRTETQDMVLPGRQFNDPLALALVEQRRILAMDANQQRFVANLLDAVSSSAPEYVEKPADVIAMRTAYRRLVDARNDDQLRSVLDLLWEIALGVEFGDLSEVERRLREAQERLSEALENGASQEEIDQLMKELRQAMNEMMQALAEQQRQNPNAQNPLNQQNAQTLTQNDLERMMDRIEDLAKSGSPDAARQLLSELQRMMDNMRSGRHEQQRQAEGNELNQALDKLSELMQEQQELLNESYRMQREQQRGLQQGQREQGQQQQGQRQQGQRQGQQQGQEPGQQRGGQQGDRGQQGQGQENRPGQQPGGMTQEEFAEALRQLQQQQEALQQQLSELGQQLEELGLGQSEELGQAEGEMGRAGENLSEGRPGSAAGNQSQALEALRQGAQNMMEQMAGDRQQGGQQQSQGNGQGQASPRQSRDPLGRRAGNSDGLNADSDVQVPGEIDAQRARRILDAIRDRLSIPDNPLIEKDYLERLLNTE